jgi:hypothetical protein
MAYVCGMNYSAPVHCSSTGHPWSGGGGLDDDSTDDRNDYTPWNNRNEDLVVASTVSVQDESDFDPMASITVQMSIWKELSAGQPSDENQVRKRKSWSFPVRISLFYFLSKQFFCSFFTELD